MRDAKTDMSMSDVADEARYPYRRANSSEDLPGDLQQKVLNVSAGDVLEPITRGMDSRCAV